MKKFALLSLAALSLPMSAVAQVTMMPATAPMANSPLSAQDRAFVITAAAAGLSEVQEGQLAASKGDSAVQTIGNRMVSDHSKANDRLKSLATYKGIILSDQVTAPQAAELTQLQGLTGASFDTAYLKDQRRAHEKAIKLFETEASSGTDPDLKSFASNTLPTLQMHLQMIKAAE